MDCRILLCGVGGQGTILAAHVLAEAAILSGLDVKVSEIHGMAQRGGSVTTVVSFGQTVYSMVCGKGEADIVVAFEKLEALRYLDLMKINGKLIVNDEIIKPASVLTGSMELPQDMDILLGSLNALMVPAEAEARESGSSKASNIVMLGALSQLLPFTMDIWIDAIQKNAPPKTIETNINAFKLGRAFAKEHIG